MRPGAIVSEIFSLDPSFFHFSKIPPLSSLSRLSQLYRPAQGRLRSSAHGRATALRSERNSRRAKVDYSLLSSQSTAMSYMQDFERGTCERPRERARPENDRAVCEKQTSRVVPQRRCGWKKHSTAEKRRRRRSRAAIPTLLKKSPATRGAFSLMAWWSQVFKSYIIVTADVIAIECFRGTVRDHVFYS